MNIAWISRRSTCQYHFWLIVPLSYNGGSADTNAGMFNSFFLPSLYLFIYFFNALLTVQIMNKNNRYTTNKNYWQSKNNNDNTNNKYKVEIPYVHSTEADMLLCCSAKMSE